MKTPQASADEKLSKDQADLEHDIIALKLNLSMATQSNTQNIRSFATTSTVSASRNTSRHGTNKRNIDLTGKRMGRIETLAGQRVYLTQVQTIEQIVNDVKNAANGRLTKEQIAGAKEALAVVQNDPEQSFALMVSGLQRLNPGISAEDVNSIMLEKLGDVRKISNLRE